MLFIFKIFNTLLYYIIIIIYITKRLQPVLGINKVTKLLKHPIDAYKTNGLSK